MIPSKDMSSCYLDPSKNAAENLALMMQKGAETTKREAELARQIEKFPPGWRVAKPSSAALIIGGIATGIIFTLVMSDPLFLLVGLGFSAIGGGTLTYKRFEYRKLIKVHEEEKKPVEEIIEAISRYFKDARSRKITILTNHVNTYVRTKDSLNLLLGEKGPRLKDKSKARQWVQDHENKYDEAEYNKIKEEAKWIYDQIENDRFPVAESVKSKVILSTNKVLEKTTKRTRITIYYDKTFNSFMAKQVTGTERGMIVNK